MRLIDSILAELGRETEITANMLARVPGDKLGWQPHAKSMTLGKLAWHIASLPAFVASSILADGVDVASTARPAVPDNVEAIREAFKQNSQLAKDTLDKIDDASATAEWTFSAGGKTIAKFPRIGFARTILMNHTVHHRGQLSVYLRLLDIPVPSVYGPSADENPFA